MTWTRFILAILIGITLTADASAQFFPVIPLPAINQAGIAFRLGGRHLQVRGFVPLGDPYPVIMPVTPTPFGFRQVAPAYLPPYYYYGYPPIAPGFPFPGYGVIEQRFTVQIINPPGLGARAGLREMPDLSGIDLDLEGPDKIWGPKKGAVNVAAAKNREAPRAAAPPEKKQQLAAAPAPPPPAPPKPAPIPEGQRLVEQGVAAFKTGEYGIALLRFRQAADANPPGPRAPFLQAQASIAVGKYKDAAQLIQKGLDRQPNWPVTAFRPKAELYDNKDDAWKEHRTALENAQKLDPNNADLLFLLGYLAWYSGEDESAVGFFRRSGALAADRRWSEAFLRLAKGN